MSGIGPGELTPRASPGPSRAGAESTPTTSRARSGLTTRLDDGGHDSGDNDDDKQSIDSDHIDSEHLDSERDEPPRSAAAAAAARSRSGGQDEQEEYDDEDEEVDSDVAMMMDEPRRSGRLASSKGKSKARAGSEWTAAMSKERSKGGMGARQKKETKLLDKDINLNLPYDPWMEIYVSQYGPPPAFITEALEEGTTGNRSKQPKEASAANTATARPTTAEAGSSAQTS